MAGISGSALNAAQKFVQNLFAHDGEFVCAVQTKYSSDEYYMEFKFPSFLNDDTDETYHVQLEVDKNGYISRMCGQCGNFYYGD